MNSNLGLLSPPVRKFYKGRFHKHASKENQKADGSKEMCAISTSKF